MSAALSTSWIPVSPESHFSLQNIPFGVFSPEDNSTPRCGTVIGETVIDLAGIYDAGLLDGTGLISNVFQHSSLNSFLEYSKETWRNVRNRIQTLLNAEGPSDLRSNTEMHGKCFFNLSKVSMMMPFEVKEYTDFYSSREHATNVGIMFRGKDNALQPNWLHLPVGYHGRASSVVISGTDIIRPSGQVQVDATKPELGSKYSPCRLLDFELELGIVLGGKANKLGEPIAMSAAEDRIFGIVLLNDWSARDIQAWEYVPLGPFTAKNFATSISPWVVTLDALEAFRTSSTEGAQQTNPAPLGYLQDGDYSRGFYDIQLEVALSIPNEVQVTPEEVQAVPETILARGNSNCLYWNMKQQLVHHSVSGAPMRAGDLLGTGTISGPAPGTYGSMLELTWRGANTIPIHNGTVRKFLEDGDVVTMRGVARGQGYNVGFGEVKGKILPARNMGI
jgi:fumarylacetoacetase